MSIELLQRRGDPLERAIVRDAAGPLGQILDPYAAIWARHIFPRREPDRERSRVPPEWMDFAGSHYTALIRLYFAYKAVDRLRIMCERELPPDPGEVLLEIHCLTAAYWWNVGSAIDNLGAAFADAPCTNLKKGKGGKKIKQDYPELGKAYDRRTQFIHSRIVPIGVEAGMPYFHFKYLESEVEGAPDLPKYTDWTMEYRGRKELLEDFYGEQWRTFLGTMTSVWFRLKSWLHDEDKDLPVKPVPPARPAKPEDMIDLGHEHAPSNIEIDPNARPDLENLPPGSG